ncbi:DUF1345 domain-containing protein [Occultella gossypii]|uniref:DUF1345 domain-containing protein n=1 Tax=Occultella gossypii TaxID=2800820 RepID=A0ABS7S9Z6_9MICO|nr:DUF1345 domain-containing protein [Occultella gossypii]MBZ2197092.1 DUF1345 domain-containing protein [Occultella gossypii]
MTSEPSRLASMARSDSSRIGVSAIGATVLTAVVVTTWVSLDPDMVPFAFVIGCIVAWALLSGINAALAHATFRRLRGADLVRALGVDPGTEPGTEPGAEPETEPGTTGPLRRREADLSRTTVQLSALALVVVALLAFLDGVRSEPGLVAAGLVMVVLSWLNVVVCYAIEYARSDLREPGMAFPGAGEPSFLRYLYVALAVQSTFGTTDVEITTDRMRGVTMTHGLLAFVFNTVILAVVVSLLLGA